MESSAGGVRVNEGAGSGRAMASVALGVGVTGAAAVQPDTEAIATNPRLSAMADVWILMSRMLGDSGEPFASRT